MGVGNAMGNARNAANAITKLVIVHNPNSGSCELGLQGHPHTLPSNEDVEKE